MKYFAVLLVIFAASVAANVMDTRGFGNHKTGASFDMANPAQAMAEAMKEATNVAAAGMDIAAKGAGLAAEAGAEAVQQGASMAAMAAKTSADMMGQ